MVTERESTEPKPIKVDEKIADLMERAQNAPTIYQLGFVVREASYLGRKEMTRGNKEDSDKYYEVKSHGIIMALEKSTNGEPGLHVRNILRTRSDGEEVARLQIIFSNGEYQGDDDDPSPIKTDATMTQLKDMLPGLEIDFTRSCLA